MTAKKTSKPSGRLIDKVRAARGRPTKYRREFAEQARRLALLGVTDSVMAGFFCGFPGPPSRA